MAEAETPIDASTLTGKLIMGYQGWFACPGDAAKRGWVHWFDKDKPTIDLLPDMRDVPAAGHCASPLQTKGGHLDVFTDQVQETVDRHFQWMQAYGLDGVALQRFATILLHPDITAAGDRILDHVRRSAEAHGRVFFLMYDLSGMPRAKLLPPPSWGRAGVGAQGSPDDAGRCMAQPTAGHDTAPRAVCLPPPQPKAGEGEDGGLRAADLTMIAHDWARLEAQGLTKGPAYLHHRGHPLLGLWGLGFHGRPMRPADAQSLFDALEKASAPYGGLTILGGVPLGWRTGTHGADADPGWQTVWRRLGVISPWTVGAYKEDSQVDAYKTDTLLPDMAAAKRLGADFMPVVFPGFSWANMMTARHMPEKAIRNQIPRHCGRFYWRQIFNALSAGAGMIYGAMFDEVDEGTAMFKLVPSADELPADQWFLTLDADGCKLPSDYYLRLAGAATTAVHKRRASEAMPYP